MVRMCDCIWGLWVALSSRLIAFAALTERLPLFSSLSARSTSFIMFRILFWISLFLVIESRVSTARARRCWFSFSLSSLFDVVIMQASKRLLIYLLVAFECFCGRWSQRDLPTQHWMTDIYISEAFSQPTKNILHSSFPSYSFPEDCVWHIDFKSRSLRIWSRASFQEILN